MRSLTLKTLLSMVLVLAMTSLGIAAQVKVVMLAEYRPAYLEWQEQMVAEFEQANPHIDIELVPTTGSTVAQKMQVMLAGNTPIDIGFMDPYLILDWARLGIIEDLTPYVQQNASQFQDFYPAVFDMFRLDQGLYALPFDFQLGAVFYNVDQYYNAGLAQPKPGWTYEDLMRNAKRLTMKNSEGTVTRYGYRIPSNRNWAPVIWAFGGDLVDDWNDPQAFIGDSTPVVRALEWLAEMVSSEAAPNKALNNSFPLAGGFANQTLAMVQSNSVSMDTFSSIDAFTWDVAPLPEGPGGKGNYVNAIGWFMFSSSKVKAETWEVLKFFSSRETLQKRVEMTGVVPPSARVIQTAWLPSRTMPVSRASLLTGIEQARSPYTLTRDLWTVLETHTLQAIWGETAISAALANMSDQFKVVSATLQQ